MLSYLKRLMEGREELAIDLALLLDSARWFDGMLLAVDELGIVVRLEQKLGFYPWTAIRGINVKY